MFELLGDDKYKVKSVQPMRAKHLARLKKNQVKLESDTWQCGPQFLFSPVETFQRLLIPRRQTHFYNTLIARVETVESEFQHPIVGGLTPLAVLPTPLPTPLTYSLG